MTLNGHLTIKMRMSYVTVSVTLWQNTSRKTLIRIWIVNIKYNTAENLKQLTL